MPRVMKQLDVSVKEAKYIQKRLLKLPLSRKMWASAKEM